MSIDTEYDLAGITRAGAVVQEALSAMQQSLKPGMTTEALDAVGAAVFRRHGARSAPNLVYGFPGTNIICINDEIVHGIPGDRVIQPGDLVTIDVTAELDGFIADAAVTVPMEPIDHLKQRLCECAETAFYKAIEVARAGEPINVIGRAIEDEVKRNGFSVIPDLSGHGVGRSIHEDPVVSNYYDARDTEPLTEGLVITIEPIVVAGSSRWYEDEDGWTVKTADGSLSAHFEHTMVITDGKPILLTDGRNIL